jgi:hypothetical protein
MSKRNLQIGIYASALTNDSLILSAMRKHSVQPSGESSWQRENLQHK